MVNVTDSTDIYMRFGSFEFLFSHNFAFIMFWINFYYNATIATRHYRGYKLVYFRADGGI